MPSLTPCTSQVVKVTQPAIAFGLVLRIFKQRLFHANWVSGRRLVLIFTLRLRMIKKKGTSVKPLFQFRSSSGFARLLFSLSGLMINFYNSRRNLTSIVLAISECLLIFWTNRWWRNHNKSEAASCNEKLRNEFEYRNFHQHVDWLLLRNFRSIEFERKIIKSCCGSLAIGPLLCKILLYFPVCESL